MISPTLRLERSSNFWISCKLISPYRNRGYCTTLYNPIHQGLVASKLTRETGNLVPDVWDELDVSVSAQWGNKPGEEREIVVWDVAQRIVGQVTNRVFVGAPLCRNQALVEAGIGFAQAVPLTASILRFIWQPLRPLLSSLITIPNRVYARRFIRVLQAEIDRRMAAWDRRQAKPETLAADELPNDFLEWSIAQAKAIGNPYDSTTRALAGRIMLLNFVAIHTSSFALTHVIFDLAAGKRGHIHELRAEIATALSAHGGKWTKLTLADMPKIDSTMRESQRLNSFMSVGLTRLVIAPEGVTTPSGVHIPAANILCTHAYEVLNDENIYAEPNTFMPFRFLEKRTDEGVETPQRARQAWAKTSPTYLIFGHGRHACMGRFFASSELKLTLAYLLLNYDFEVLEERPSNTWILSNLVPPVKAKLKVKRREVSSYDMGDEV